MATRLTPIDPVRDLEALSAFLSSHRFPFHLGQRPSIAEARARVARGAFSAPEHLAFWIEHGDAGRVGILDFDEMPDDAPMIDLRLAEDHRGRGIGSAALRLGTSAVFEARPAINRIEGNTRSDNAAMRRVFERSGYVKEAHYREAWPVEGAEAVDTVAYAVIRRDWRSGTITPVPW